MTRRAVLALLLVAAAACADDDPGRPGGEPPPTTTSPAAPSTPSPLPGASCDPIEGGSFDNVPDFVHAEVSHDEGVDRIEFTFELKDPEATEPPSFGVRFVDRLVTDGEGAPAEVEGEAFLQVHFNAVGTDLSGETPVPVYTGPDEFTTGFSTLVEAEKIGDFESVITWGLGLAFRGCPRVEASPTSLTVEVPAL